MTSEARPIRFLLNGSERCVSDLAPTTTVLRYLRESERLTGTKEGCAEGDCGACTVMLAEPDGAGGIERRAVNACIQFLPAMNGRAIETVEGLGTHGGTQGAERLRQEMVERHASQCGFCTPGFVVQLFSGWMTGAMTDRQSVKDLVSGNLCRCTGYGPIIEAGEALAASGAPGGQAGDAALAETLLELEGPGIFTYSAPGAAGEMRWFAPTNVDDLADTYAAYPEAVLVAGATDVGLRVTKQHRDLPVLIDVSKVRDLTMVEERLGKIYLGAGVTHRKAREALGDVHPDLSEMLRRFAGYQIRNAGTVGGNCVVAKRLPVAGPLGGEVDGLYRKVGEWDHRRNLLRAPRRRIRRRSDRFPGLIRIHLSSRLPSSSANGISRRVGTGDDPAWFHRYVMHPCVAPEVSSQLAIPGSRCEMTARNTPSSLIDAWCPFRLDCRFTQSRDWYQTSPSWTPQ